MAFLVLGANSVSGYTVKNSLRFNSGSSDYLSRTTWGTPTDAKIFTLSLWVKRSTLGARNSLVGSYDGVSASSFLFSFESNDTLYIQLGGASDYILQTTQLFRDVSAWYHIVYVVDSTQATSSNRQKLYVNGTQVTAFGTANYTTLNSTTKLFNNSNRNNIGAEWQISGFLNGYLSEFYFIDGQALTPSSFGETDTDTGIWKPKAYTGTYGTNGFYLKFANSASLGTDSSGNGNTFTVNNLTSVDQSTDTPTNNFCTANPLWNSVQVTYTEGNLRTVNTSVHTPAVGTIAVSSGKWYFEGKAVAGTASKWTAGIFDTANTYNKVSGTNYLPALEPASSYAQGNAVSYYNNNLYKDGSTIITTVFSSGNIASGDIIQVAFDCDNGKIWFGKNGTWNNGAGTESTTWDSSNHDTTFTTGRTYYIHFTNENCGWDWNTGNPPYSANSYTDGAGYGNFSYSVPSGYYSLNTKNLATFG